MSGQVASDARAACPKWAAQMANGLNATLRAETLLVDELPILEPRHTNERSTCSGVDGNLPHPDRNPDSVG